jgi:glycopeptide antibiotics resistance protein
MSALYLFDERGGRTVHNYAGGGCDLYIPEIYTVVDKLSLQPFWKEFNFSRSYWSGNIKNIVGFIPLGACWFVYFLVVQPVKKPELATVILGALVSLTIESLQAFLPTRDSGTTDLLTNTLGTYSGVRCGKYLYRCLQEVTWEGVTERV